MKHEKIIRFIVVGIILTLTYWFGIRPVLDRDYFNARVASLKGVSHDEYGLVVLGTEPEGIAAALSAARLGVKTLIVTEDIDVGSYIKSALVSSITPEYAVINNQKRNLNTGIYSEIFGDITTTFSAEDYIFSVKKLVEREPKITIFYEAGFISAQTNNNLVESVTVYHRGKSHIIKAPIFVDATEDGKLLSFCENPYFLGSEDINVKKAYMPLHFNFIISDVFWEDIESLRKQSQHITDFSEVLANYERYSQYSKIPNLSFIGIDNNEMVISGLRVNQVNVNDEEELEYVYDEALIEAKFLTAYLKTAFIPFENCNFKAGPASFYIPEYKHYKGKYTLTVEDILENRDFPTKVVLASSPVDADKFISSSLPDDYTYIIGNPIVYSIPLESYISYSYDNLLMTGKKASFTSLASTSAGKIPVSITSGHSLGVTAFYCALKEITPYQLANASTEILEDYSRLLKRSGVFLTDFNKENPNTQHWAWDSVKQLTQYGLIAGGMNNDYRFSETALNENLSLLIINKVVKVKPETYTLNFDKKVRAYADSQELTGKTAAKILLTAKDIPFEENEAFDKAIEHGLIPNSIIDKISPDSKVTLDCVYELVVNLVNKL